MYTQKFHFLLLSFRSLTINYLQYLQISPYHFLDSDFVSLTLRSNLWALSVFWHLLTLVFSKPLVGFDSRSMWTCGFPFSYCVSHNEHIKCSSNKILLGRTGLWSRHSYFLFLISIYQHVHFQTTFSLFDGKNDFLVLEDFVMSTFYYR